MRNGDLLEPPALDGIAAFRVRVDGDDVYVDRFEEPRRGRTMPMYACDPEQDPRVVAIIGAGAAAAAAAEALRQLFFIGRIVMIGPEEQWPYDRPNLSKDFLAGELEAKWLPLRSPEFYEEHTIERVVGRVTGLDVSTRTLTLDDGTAMTPDAVLIASGARPRRLPVPGGTCRASSCCALRQTPRRWSLLPAAPSAPSSSARASSAWRPRPASCLAACM